MTTPIGGSPEPMEYGMPLSPILSEDTTSTESPNYSVENFPPYIRLPSSDPFPHIPTPQKSHRPPEPADNEFPVGTYWYFDDQIYVLRELKEDVAYWVHLHLEIPPKE